MTLQQTLSYILLTAIYHAAGSLTGNTVLDVDNHCNLSVSIDQAHDTVTINMTGPDDKWFGVGFGNTTECPECMTDCYAIVCHGDVCQENKLATRGYGTKLDSSIKVMSDTKKNEIRSVSVTRKIAGDGDDYFTFPSKAGSMDIIHAIGRDGIFEESTEHMGSGGPMKFSVK